MNTETPSLCPECGTPFPAESQHHVCPACLMAQALASRTIATGGEKPGAVPPPPPDEIADRFPSFEITECLGRGGMGVVYKARQKSLDRWVAIKILAPEREHDTRFAERFAREAQTLARLNHPNIVHIFDYGETGGLYYFVMEFVDGVNLRDLLHEGRIEPKQALAIVPPICDALQYAHDKGIVHRDIKPENLLLDREGRVKIADFGIASLVGAKGESAGTPPYMAPEQASAKAEVDHRADIYALGVVLYEMLTGERPAKEAIAPSRRVEIDVRLDEIVLRALEKKPELRYQQASIFKTQVETIAEGMGSAAAPAAPVDAPSDGMPEEGSNSARMTRALPGESRFSRMAILGACWAAAAALHFLIPTLGYRMKSEFVPIMMMVIGISAPFGTTILGWIAVTQIRRSGGKLRGLELAVFDGVLFPLLALDSFLLGMVLFAHSRLVWASLGQASGIAPLAGRGSWELILPSLILLAFLDWLVVRRIWRAVNQFAAFQSAPPSAPNIDAARSDAISPRQVSSQTRRGASRFALGLAAAMAILLLILALGWVIGSIHAVLVVSMLLGLRAWRTPAGKIATVLSVLLLLLFWTVFTSNYLPPRHRPLTGGGLTTSYTPLKNSNLFAALSAEYDKSAGRGFKLGKPIEVTLRFYNFSSADLVLNPQELPPTVLLKVTDSAGKRVELAGKSEAASLLKEIRVLKSRDGTAAYAMSLLLLPKSARATAPKGNADAMAWVEPGRYNLQFQLRPPATSEQPDGSSSGEYRTTPLTINVKGPPATSNATKPQPGFGPVVEREMRLGGKVMLCGLDFESGDLTLTEDEFRRGDDEETERKWYRGAEGWVQSKGVDMVIGGSGEDFGLAGLEAQFKLEGLPAAAWETATEAELKRALGRFRMWNDNGWAVLKITSNSSVPATFALRCGNRLGLLQITERLQSPDRIRIRYKLVQSELPAAPEPAAAEGANPASPPSALRTNDPEVKLSKPEVVKQLPTEEIIVQGLKRPSRAWTEWQEIIARMEAGKLTKEEGARIFRGATEWLKREHPEGWPDMEVLYFFGSALEMLWKQKLVSESQVLDFLQAFYAKPLIEPLARIREGSPVRMDLTLHQEFYRQLLGHKLLNEIRSITVNGRSIEAQPLYGHNGHSANAEDYRVELQVADLAPGKYTVKVEMDTALVTVADAVNLEVQTPPEQWPPARRHWQRTCEAELLVYAKDAEIVALSDDPALNPLTAAELSARPITIRRTEGKQIAAVTVRGNATENAPFSVSITLKLAGKSYPAGRYFNDGKGHYEWEGAHAGIVSDLIVAIDDLDPQITEAELLLAPDPRFIESQPGVAKIWAKEIVLSGIPLKRLDLADPQPKSGNPPRGKRPVLPGDFEKLPNEELIRLAIEEPDDLGPWNAMKKRVETGQFGASDADAWVAGLTELVRKDRSETLVSKLIGFPRQLIEELHRRRLLVERRTLEYLQALHGDGRVRFEPPSPAKPAPGFVFDTNSLYNERVDQWLGFALLRQVGPVTVDGRSVEVLTTGKRLHNAPEYSCELESDVPPGKHTLEADVFSALVAADDVAGLNDKAPRAEWPPLKHSWNARLKVDFQIPAEHAAPGPGTTK